MSIKTVNEAADSLIYQLESHNNTYYDRDVAKALAVFNSATGTLASDKAVTICTLLKNAHHIAPPVGKVPLLSNAYAMLNNLVSRITSLAFGKLFKPAWISCQELLPVAMSKCFENVSPEFAFDCAAIDIAKDAVIKNPKNEEIKGFCSKIQSSVNNGEKKSVLLNHLNNLLKCLSENKILTTDSESLDKADILLDTWEAEQKLGFSLQKNDSPLAEALSQQLSSEQVEKIQTLKLDLPEISSFSNVGIIISPEQFNVNFDKAVQNALPGENLPNMSVVASRLLRHSPEYSFYLLTQAESWMSLSKDKRIEAANNLLQQSVSTLYGIDKERIRAALKSLGVEEPVFLSKMIANLEVTTAISKKENFSEGIRERSSFPSGPAFDRSDKPSAEYPYACVLTVRKNGEKKRLRNICLGFFKDGKMPNGLNEAMSSILTKSSCTVSGKRSHIIKMVREDRQS